jgi:F-type H+-transporting ATPase subunit gamma
MEMVAASKMKRAQDTALSGRPYSQELTNILNRLSQNMKTLEHPLLSPGNPTASVLFVIISTDKGLCGSLNTNLFSQLEKLKPSSKSLVFITAGKKARDYISKTSQNLIASFTDLPDRPTSEDVRPISKMITEGFINQEYSEVWIVYPEFISTLSQETRIAQLLPLGKLDSSFAVSGHKNNNKNYPSEVELKETKGDYLFEPSPHQILNHLLPLYIENRLFQLLLETKASEQSARMIAMKNAHDNAKELSSDLTLTYNRLRQARVTNELLDAVSSRMALS